MATTTNYGWTTPDDTALVKDGASAIRSLGTSVDTTTKALNPSTTLGDIEYRSSTANTNTRLAIGSTGNVLTVAGGVPTWAAPAGGGKVLQVISNSTTTYSGSASATFADTGLTATITPTSATSKILVIVNQNGCGKTPSNNNTALMLQLVRGATTLSISNSVAYTATTLTTAGESVGAPWLDDPATTSATTYKTQYASYNSESSVFVQDDSRGGGVNRSTIILMEIGA
jgi:hypothetical protein